MALSIPAILRILNPFSLKHPKLQDHLHTCLGLLNVYLDVLKSYFGFTHDCKDEQFLVHAVRESVCLLVPMNWFNILTPPLLE